MKDFLRSNRKILIFDLLFVLAVIIFCRKLRLWGTVCVGLAFAVLSVMCCLAGKYENARWFKKLGLVCIVLIYLLLLGAFFAYVYLP